MRHWWEKEPLRIVEICNAYELNALTLEQEVEAVRKLRGNVQHFHCTDDSGGGDDRRFFFKTSVSKADNLDRLKVYLPLAHKNGIRIIVYLNVHWYSSEFGKEHPDWLQIKENGHPIDDVYTTGTSFCVNSHYRDWVFQIVKDLCKYEVDGIFYDGPIFFSSTCYCRSCEGLFGERTGRNLPPKSSRDDPLWKELIAFQSDSIARFLSDSESLIKAANPDILFCMNGNSNWPYWPTGRDNHKIIKHTDILGAEGGFIYNDLNLTPIYKPGIAAKLLKSQSEAKPALVFDCAGHKPWSWYLLPRQEIGMLLAETLAGGANFWIPLFPSDLSQSDLNVVALYNKIVEKNPKAFFGTKSLAKVALLWPSVSVEMYEGSSIPLTDFTKEIKPKGVGDIGQEFLGFYEGLGRSQVPFDVIDEENFKDLSRYDLLVLPNAACLSKESCEILKQFVARGGNIVASFETSLYDENGKRQEDFQLAELFGVRFLQSIFGPMNWDYVSPASATNSPFMRGVTKKWIPAPTYGIKVETTAGKTLLYYSSKLIGCYDHTPEVSSNPFLVLNHLDKGEVVYLAGSFGISLVNFRFPEYLNLVSNIATDLSSATVTVRDAPWVEFSLRANENDVFVHLVNQTSGLRRPLTYVHPLTNVTIDLSKIRAKEGKALRLDRKLKLRKSGSKKSLVLPYLEDYEIIALKLSGPGQRFNRPVPRKGIPSARA